MKKTKSYSFFIIRITHIDNLTVVENKKVGTYDIKA